MGTFSDLEDEIGKTNPKPRKLYGRYKLSIEQQKSAKRESWYSKQQPSLPKLKFLEKE